MVPNDSLERELIDVAIRTRWSDVGITVPDLEQATTFFADAFGAV